MNIKDAKEQIKNAISVYFSKDDFGNFIIPPERQRPVFLMGPPGIGKTAVMAQIAGELGVGLLSYSMTHHTRQSALGLPFITKRVYGGREYDISEYTMSEIIASVYEVMEASNIREGILFLDEINCVSETLAPAMLQFLQYKTFGRHRVPDGWIVVTAGNPPEYNKSVREFDTVTWDRLKRIDVEPDFEAWKAFAYEKGVHPAVMTYLEARKDDFYSVEQTAGGKQFVTARGWVDLSDMLHLYESKGIEVDGRLVSQYLQKPEVAKRFAIYYDLFRKYRSDYQIDTILAGQAPPDILRRAKEARFDERYSLLGLLLDSLSGDIRQVRELSSAGQKLLLALRAVKAALEAGTALDAALEAEIAALGTELESGRAAANLSGEGRRTLQRAVRSLEALLVLVRRTPGGDMTVCADYYRRFIAEKAEGAACAAEKLENAFTFCESAFGQGQEMLILVTELTLSEPCAWFIATFGSAGYVRHNKGLLFHERQRELLVRLDALDAEI